MPLRSSGLQAFRAGFPQHRDVQDRLSNKVVAPTDPVSNSLGWNSNTDAMFRKHSADDRFCPDNGMVANRRALQNGYVFTEPDVIADRDICGQVYPRSAGIVDNRMHVAVTVVPEPNKHPIPISIVAHSCARREVPPLKP